MTTDAVGHSHPQTDSFGWESEQLLKHLTRRTASEDARFMLDYLKPGMQVLDCGCGPGSITLGLASYIAPGRILGVDISPQLIEQAKTAAAEQGVSNARFEVGDALVLPFDDSTFDFVFSHALMEHLPRPMEGLAQLKRVLKPGGVIAIRTPDWGGNMLYPDENDLHRRVKSLQERLFERSGSDPNRGRRIGTLLEAQGFVDLCMTASYTSYGTRERLAAFTQLSLDYLQKPTQVQTILEKGWATQDEIDQVNADLSTWAQMPGAFHMRTWIEAVARKP